LSGFVGVSRFPTSTSVDDLTAGFKSSVNSFISAIQKAGGRVSISATYRSSERAYLMHYAWEIAHEKVAPNKVPAKAGVDIQWDHGDDQKSIKAAKAMVAGYDIVREPSLTTNHAQRTAIDMVITGLVGKMIAKKDGTQVKINKDNRNTTDLEPIGASYGVYHKVRNDYVHWSADGH
jgi:hypothetical protein